MGAMNDPLLGHKLVTPDQVIARLKPGMSIFIGTGAAEPRTLVKTLMGQQAARLQDLELIQLVSFGEAISLDALRCQRYRLKTFFAGWVAHEAVVSGQVDLIPTRFAWVPDLVESGQLPIHVAFVQISPPDRSGNCSLGVAVDVARQAMEKASLVVGEINAQTPRTFGDTFVHLSDFHCLVNSDAPLIYFDRWPIDAVFDAVAAHVADLIPDNSCIAFSIGPLFEALARHLRGKRHLGVHSPFFTDALKDLVESGAVTNRRKDTYRGKSLVSYALGTPALMQWLDQNPLVEFQGIHKVYDPAQIGRNPGFVAVVAARAVDLSGRVALQVGKGNVAAGPGEVLDFVRGAELSPGGRIIFALPSRNLKGQPNIHCSLEGWPNLFAFHESVDRVVTEYGVASLKGCTLRERAQTLIDIAHPEDRGKLVEKARTRKILYPDQVFVQPNDAIMAEKLCQRHTFKGGIEVVFRPIRPSDEEKMRRLFYRFSDEAIYARYFGHIQSMPHARLQHYVNVDWRQTVSIVGLVEENFRQKLVAEARYIREGERPWAEVVFVVDEHYQRLGIASYLLGMLKRIALEQGLLGFDAEVLLANSAMMKVFRKSGLAVTAHLDGGTYHVEMRF